MKNLSISRLLGIALITGGVIVGLIMIVLMSNYASEGKFTTIGATMAVIAAFILIVLPQIGLGVYLIWNSLQETAVISTTTQNVSSPENENTPPPK